MESNRTFKIIIVEHEEVSVFKETIKSLMKKNDNCYEYIYAIDEIFDEVLDLKQGESMYFNPNRDCKNDKGIIVRIK